MSQDATVPNEELRGEPVRELRVDVTGGPSEGRSFSSADRVTIGSADGNDLQLEDRRASRFHLELSRRGEGIQIADLGSTNGTRVGPVRFDSGRVTVAAGAEIKVGRSTLKLTDGESFTRSVPEAGRPAGMVGVSRAMTNVFAQVELLGRADASVLIVGESGTGKELIARALHHEGARSGEPFITVDCAALPSNIAQSALFGHERGAFTGADRLHRGAFERAHGGTLFLDEIGELSPEDQARLLGVLERRRLVRLGGEEEIAVDVRVVSATNRDLRAEVNDGRFRLDLYYRVAVMTLAVPALRERPEDVPHLIGHFAETEGYDGALEGLFDRAAMDELQRRPWPGNVRELRNVVESAIVTGSLQPTLGALAPPSAAVELPAEPALSATFRAAKAEVVREFERRFLTRLMESTKGNVREASRVAKMHRGYLMELLVRHGLK